MNEVLEKFQVCTIKLRSVCTVEIQYCNSDVEECRHVDVLDKMSKKFHRQGSSDVLRYVVPWYDECVLKAIQTQNHGFQCNGGWAGGEQKHDLFL